MWVKEQSSSFTVLSAVASEFVPASPNVTLIKKTEY